MGSYDASQIRFDVIRWGWLIANFGLLFRRRCLLSHDDIWRQRISVDALRNLNDGSRRSDLSRNPFHDDRILNAFLNKILPKENVFDSQQTSLMCRKFGLEKLYIIFKRFINLHGTRQMFFKEWREAKCLFTGSNIEWNSWKAQILQNKSSLGSIDRYVLCHWQVSNRNEYHWPPTMNRKRRKK